MVSVDDPATRRGASWRYGLALATSALALLLTLLLAPMIAKSVFIFFFAAVFVSSLYGGWGPGLLVAAIALLSVGYFIIPPTYSFHVGLEALPQLGVFALVAFATSSVAERRRRAEQLAREQAERFRVTLASIGDGVIVTDAAGNVTFMNALAQELTGRSASQAVGAPSADVFRIVNAGTRQQVESPVARALRDGRAANLANHTLLIAQDGTERPIDDSAAPIRSVDGATHGVVLVFRDVSERQRAEAELRASRDQLAVILRGVADGITAQDASGRLVYANDAIARASGYGSAQEMLAAPIADVLGRFTMLDEAGRPFPLELLPGRRALQGEAEAEAIIRFRDNASGVERWSIVKATPVHDEHGRVQLVINITRDITELRRAEQERARLLAEAQAAADAADDAREQLEALLEGMTDAVFAVDRDWRYIFVNEQASRMTGASREAMIGKSIWEVFPDVVGTLSERELRRAMREQIPVTFENYNAARGVWGETRLYPSAEGLTAFTRDITAQKRAEQLARAAAERTSRLQLVTAAMASALTPLEIAEAVLREGLAAVDGDAGSIALLSPDGAALELVHAVGYPPDIVERARRVSVSDPSPQADTVRARAPLFIASRAETVERWPHLAAALETIPWHAWADLPLLADGRAIGALDIAFRQERAFSADDRAFLAALAQQCSQALERARLYEAEHQARTRAESTQRRVSFLADVTARLTSSLDYASRWQQVADAMVPTLADFCFVYVQQPDGWIERVAVAHRDPAQAATLRALQTNDRIDPNGPNPVAQVFRTGEAVVRYQLVGDEILEHVQGEAQRDAAAQLAPQAFMLLPLSARGRTIGAMSFVRNAPDSRYDTDDGVLAGEVARRAALALDNARLYRDAQEAIQLRDQFLSIAAHELKTPLTTLLGTAQLLQRRDQRDNVLAPRERRGVEIIVNQATRLNAMILALLDVSRLEKGQLTIERAQLDLADILRRLVGEVESSLDGRAIELELPAEPLAVAGDALRLEQVFQNLIQNALKYSSPPEPIVVRVRRDDHTAVVAIRDCGIGIPQAALPQLFQRFYRASNAKETHVAGMGIGLYVVREIVALHGGEITVESAEGAGSTFTVTLPLTTSDE